MGSIACAGVSLWFTALICTVGLLFVYPAFLMLCWNYFMPHVFGVTRIGYWQAFVLRLGWGFMLPPSNGFNFGAGFK